jgi:homoserine dehydrogenase
MTALLEAHDVDDATAVPTSLRTIRVGLVGLGQVGQAVARLASDTARLRDAGVKFKVLGALVRDVEKPRRCARPPRITNNPSAFLRGNYDVVVEALGAIEPARAIVSRLLGRGIPVVTANKALVAAHGQHLAGLAARRGTTLRYEASALAGVPFLGALAARPLVSDVQRFTAVVNGTSNFILSRLDAEPCTFDEALAEAQSLGLTEPDPSRDLDGVDSADKLSLLSAIFGWGAMAVSRIELQGIRGITGQDLAIARTLGATIKPVAHAALTPAGVSAFIGPAIVPLGHPLAALNGTLSGIQLSGRFVSDLFFSGPGAGPDITAATILDDAVEAVSTVPKALRPTRRTPRIVPLAAAPPSGWLVRVRFPGIAPDVETTAQVFAPHYLQTVHVVESGSNTRYLRVAPCSREAIDSAIAAIHATHRVQCLAWRAL